MLFGSHMNYLYCGFARNLGRISLLDRVNAEGNFRLFGKFLVVLSQGPPNFDDYLLRQRF